MPVLIVGYADAKRLDDAFTTGATYLASIGFGWRVGRNS